MKAPTILFLLGAVVLNLALSLYLLATREHSAPEIATGSAASKTEPEEVRHLQQSLAGIRAELRDLQQTFRGIPAPEGPPSEDGDSNQENDRAIPSLAERLASMERSIATLQSSMDGINLEAASAERDALFAGENGNLKADAYFEAGKYAIAGEGYLKFLEAHPEHPDHRNILERARNSFNRAGYMDKALWAQEELMRIYPDSRTRDLMTMANLEKLSGRFAKAAAHAAESASLDQSNQRYWSLLYAAWYTELGQGPQAGLEDHRNVQQQIAAAGFGDGKLGERAQEKIEELERRIASGQ